MHTSTETHQAGPQGLRFRLIAGEYNTGSLRASWIFRFNETNVDVSRFRTVVSFPPEDIECCNDLLRVLLPKRASVVPDAESRLQAQAVTPPCLNGVSHRDQGRFSCTEDCGCSRKLQVARALRSACS